MIDFKLIRTETVRDEYGQEFETETSRWLEGIKKPITRYEFYQAAASDLSPEFAVDMHRFEYEGERVLEFDGERYSISRTFEHEADGIEWIELTAARRVGV